MAYVSLYRKYRPRTFEDVVGQEHVTRTLANAIEEDRLSHAYLFTGPRGTGKTSTARILASALNCESGPTPRPCGSCEQCTAITEGSSVDVIELDMASHGGVDDARDLRDRALFAPARARRKVYILDEVHMASTAAFNALLKLIEEPPGHVLFAMATTDPQKVIPTILSRVQRLDLRRVAAVTLAEHVRHVCAAEGYAIDAGAVEAVVRAGDGSVRDTLSVLEQVLAFVGGGPDAAGRGEVTAEVVAQTLGTTPADRVLEAIDQLGDRNVAGLLGLVQQLLDDGHDLRRFTLDLVQHVRDLLVLQVAPDRPDLVDATDERRQRLQEQTSVLPREALLRAVTVLAETMAEQRQGSPRLPLELALATLATPGASGDVAELADRVARLEAGAPAGGQTPAPTEAATRAEPAEATGPPGAATRPGPAEPTAPAGPAGSIGSGGSTGAGGSAGARSPVGRSEAPTSEPAGQAARSDPDAEGRAGDVAGSAGDAEARPAASEDDLGVGRGAAEAGTAAAGEGDGGPGDELARVQSHWDGALERLKQSSRRHHAIFEPAVPVNVSRGILTLRYGRRHASFHAVQARSGELSGALTTALEHACGLRLRVEVKVEGDDERRRPLPPSVTPDDARTPVADGEAGGEPDEGIHVREAEVGGPAGEVDVDGLLRSELDARLVDEQPPPGLPDRRDG